MWKKVGGFTINHFGSKNYEIWICVQFMSWKEKLGSKKDPNFTLTCSTNASNCVLLLAGTNFTCVDCKTKNFSTSLIFHAQTSCGDFGEQILLKLFRVVKIFFIKKVLENKF
jgi:hypothetical protein